MDPPGSSGAGTVVVPSATAPSSLACLRSLGERGIRTIAVSERETAPAFDSKFCDEAYVTPDPRTDFDGYVAVLLALAERPDVQTVLPVREYDVLALARHRSEFGEHVGTPWPSAETLARVQDRIQLYAVAESSGVGVPETELLSACDDWDRELVVKARYSVAPDLLGEDDVDGVSLEDAGTIYLEPGREPPTSRIRFEMGHDPIVQAYLPGPVEYGFFALYDRGEALATFQHRQRRGYKYTGGPSAYRESIDVPSLESAGRRLLDALEWHGVAMVEFKRDPETGRFLLMEVNPRFWSSLPFTVQAGVDFPYHAWRLALGRPERIARGYEVGIGGHLLRGELLYLESVLREEYPLVERPSFARALSDVLSSILRHPRFDYLDLDDPGPFVRDVRNLIADVVHPRRTVLAKPADHQPSVDSSPGAGADPPGAATQQNEGEERFEETAH